MQILVINEMGLHPFSAGFLYSAMVERRCAHHGETPWQQRIKLKLI